MSARATANCTTGVRMLPSFAPCSLSGPRALKQREQAESPPMPRYEYKVVPAPSKGMKGKGVRGPEARFSYALQELMNGLAGYGWEYLRAETLPSVERSGLTGSATEWRNVLVFRRQRSDDVTEFQPELLPAPISDPAPATQPIEKKMDPSPKNGDFQADNGVEDTASGSTIGASLSLLARARNSLKKPGEDDSEKPSEPKA